MLSIASIVQFDLTLGDMGKYVACGPAPRSRVSRLKKVNGTIFLHECTVGRVHISLVDLEPIAGYTTVSDACGRASPDLRLPPQPHRASPPFDQYRVYTTWHTGVSSLRKATAQWC